MTILYEDLTFIFMHLHSVLHMCRMPSSLLCTCTFSIMLWTHVQTRKIKLDFVPFKFHMQKMEVHNIATLLNKCNRNCVLIVVLVLGFVDEHTCPNIYTMYILPKLCKPCCNFFSSFFIFMVSLY